MARVLQSRDDHRFVVLHDLSDERLAGLDAVPPSVRRLGNEPLCFCDDPFWRTS